jgi:hypothetical protein
MSDNKKNYVYFAIWSMNGGLIPQSAADNITRAVEDAVKKAEEDQGVRLLWSSKKMESE